MDASFTMPPEHGSDLRAKTLKLSESWPTILAKVQEMGNANYRIVDSLPMGIMFVNEDYTFTIKYTYRDKHVVSIVLGDAHYTVIVEPVPALPDKFDKLIVEGRKTLIAVGEENWYKVVNLCLEKVLFYSS
jgi:hypothetical protein